MDEKIEENLEQSGRNETQPELVPAAECTDEEVVAQSVQTDNGLPYPKSRGVFRAKLE